MALTAQQRQMWTLRLEKYTAENLTVFREALTNNHYEGDVAQALTLNIISFGELVTDNYTGAWDPSTVQGLSTTNTTFTVDQADAVKFRVPSILKATSPLSFLDEGAKKAAYAMSLTVDQYLASLYTEITSNICGASNGVNWSIGGVTGTGPITVGFNAQLGEIPPTAALALMNQGLAEANADLSDPTVVLPPWFASYLNSELGTRYTPIGDDTIRKGVQAGKLQLGQIEGWNNLWVSNLVPNTTVNGVKTQFKVMGGSPNSSITLAVNLEESAVVPIENDFGELSKSLLVYGAKIPFEQHMICGTFNQGTPRTAIH